jgi:hypothetical protein
MIRRTKPDAIEADAVLAIIKVAMAKLHRNANLTHDRDALDAGTLACDLVGILDCNLEPEGLGVEYVSPVGAFEIAFNLGARAAIEATADPLGDISLAMREALAIARNDVTLCTESAHRKGDHYHMSGCNFCGRKAEAV